MAGSAVPVARRLGLSGDIPRRRRPGEAGGFLRGLGHDLLGLPDRSGPGGGVRATTGPAPALERPPTTETPAPTAPPAGTCDDALAWAASAGLDSTEAQADACALAYGAKR